MRPVRPAPVGATGHVTAPAAVLRPRAAPLRGLTQSGPGRGLQEGDDDVARQRAHVDSLLQKQRQRLRALGSGTCSGAARPTPPAGPSPAHSPVPSQQNPTSSASDPPLLIHPPPLRSPASPPAPRRTGGLRQRARLDPATPVPPQQPLLTPDRETAGSPLRDAVSPSTGPTGGTSAGKSKRRNAASGDRIRVCVRKRPPRHAEGGDCVRIAAEPGGVVTVEIERSRIDLSRYTEGHEFAFDTVFGQSAGNVEVYHSTAQPLIETCLRGGHATVFAYGQTGSGKTHTMLGGSVDDSDGLYMLTMREVFARLPPDQRVLTSFYEIYCNALYDLLNNRAPLTLREDAQGKVNIVGISEHDVGDAAALAALMSRGDAERASGATAANDASSRSHAVLQLVVGSGTFKFIDLAGSERGADTGEAARKTQMEGAEINKSLLALKECIRGLGRGDAHVKFRGSKLTEVLRDSFVGDCRTCMIATVSPAPRDSEHTLNTLRYAHRVRGLRKRKVNSARRRRPPGATPTSQPAPTNQSVAALRRPSAQSAMQPRPPDRRPHSAQTQHSRHRASQVTAELGRLQGEVARLNRQLKTEEERHQQEVAELRAALAAALAPPSPHPDPADGPEPGDELEGGRTAGSSEASTNLEPDSVRSPVSNTDEPVGEPAG